MVVVNLVMMPPPLGSSLPNVILLQDVLGLVHHWSVVLADQIIVHPGAAIKGVGVNFAEDSLVFEPNVAETDQHCYLCSRSCHIS